MRFAVVLTGLLLILLLSTSCAAGSDPESPTAVATAIQRPAATTTPTLIPTDTPTPAPSPTHTPVPASLSPNVALHGTARAASHEDSVHFVIDGDPNSVWSAQDHPAQWIAITLDDLYLADRIELLVAQAPAGPTTHTIWLDNGSGVRTRFTQLTGIHTEDGQTLTIEINPPQPVTEILVQTLESPSWVAWREIRVRGLPYVPNNENGKAPQLRVEQILEQLVLPVQVTHAGDGSGRIFVVEQQGRITIAKDGVANETLFLDITDRVNCCEERGLFNVAFPPTFSATKQFYLSYSNSDDDTVISRFTTTDDPDVANPASEEILLTVPQPHHVHNGGRLVFGPNDGYLYVGLGDGGSDGHPVHFPQDPALLLGKILRIDVESGVQPYDVPASNPFVSDQSFRPEIWALGFRNPWGFAFDYQTGDLYIPDAGHNDREEINFQPASSRGGENYGWPTIEGTRCPRFENLPVPCRLAGTFDPPVAEYDHTRGCAIVGGVVYRGSELPHLMDRFLFADFCRGDIWSLAKPGATGNSGPIQTNQDAWQSELVLKASVPISSVGEDEAGNLYVTGYQNGVVYKITAE